MLKQWVQRWIDFQGPPTPGIGGSSGLHSEGVLFCSRHPAGESSATGRATRGRTGGIQLRSWFHRHIGNVLELCARPDHLRDEEQYRRAVIEIGRILEFIERESRRENQPVLIKYLPGLLHPDLVAVVQPSERSSPAPGSVHQRQSLAVGRADRKNQSVAELILQREGEQTLLREGEHRLLREHYLEEQITGGEALPKRKEVPRHKAREQEIGTEEVRTEEVRTEEVSTEEVRAEKIGAEEIRYLCSQSDNPFIWLETGRWIESNFPKMEQQPGSPSGKGRSSGISRPLLPDGQPVPSENGTERTVRTTYGLNRAEREALGRTICFDKPFQLQDRQQSPEYANRIRTAVGTAASGRNRETERIKASDRKRESGRIKASARIRESGRINLSSARSDTTSRNRVQAVIGIPVGKE